MRERKYNILELIQYVLRHRKNKAFRGYSPQQIGWAIERAVNNKAFAMATMPDATVAGVCCATPDHEKKVLHVHEVLCSQRGAIQAMLVKFQEWFSGYTITATRRGKPVLYRTPRLVHLLNRL